MNLESVPACSGAESADREGWPQGAKWPYGKDLLNTYRRKRIRKVLKIRYVVPSIGFQTFLYRHLKLS